MCEGVKIFYVNIIIIHLHFLIPRNFFEKSFIKNTLTLKIDFKSN
jgi:hypothetical protein